MFDDLSPSLNKSHNSTLYSWKTVANEDLYTHQNRMFYGSQNSANNETNVNLKVEDQEKTVGVATHHYQVPIAFEGWPNSCVVWRCYGGTKRLYDLRVLVTFNWLRHSICPSTDSKRLNKSFDSLVRARNAEQLWNPTTLTTFWEKIALDVD